MTDDNENTIRAAFDNMEEIALDDRPDPDLDPEADPSPMPGDGDLPPIAAYDEDLPQARAALYPLNDYGNGLRLVQYFGNDFLYVPRLGWYRWDGRRWASDEDEMMVRRDAQKIAALILDEIPYIALEDWQREALDLWREVRGEYNDLSGTDHKERSDEQRARLREIEKIRDLGLVVEGVLKDARKNHRAHSKASGNSPKISNMLAEARTAAAIDVDALNKNKMMLCCENGVLHFSWRRDDHNAAWGGKAYAPQVELLDHARDLKISKIARASYDPAAECPHWIAFLERVLPDPEVRAFLRRWFGYCLTGETSEQKLAFLFGGGRNGKSTAVDTVAKIMGDYASTLPIETLTGSEQRKGSDATPDLVRLPGARFVRASEPEQGQKMKEALIKALTGGEPIMIRRMMQEFVEILPEFKLTISGNHKPDVRGADDGIWRRIMLIPFLVQIPAADVDPTLPAKLEKEADGILAWMVQGCLDWMDGGLRPPKAVSEATEDYRRDSDFTRTFIEEECEITGSPNDFERGRDLADAFNAWMLDAGFSTFGRRTVANNFKARSNNLKGKSGHVYTPGKRSDTGYHGIKIKPDAMDRIAKYGDELRRSR